MTSIFLGLRSALQAKKLNAKTLACLKASVGQRDDFASGFVEELFQPSRLNRHHGAV